VHSAVMYIGDCCYEHSVAYSMHVMIYTVGHKTRSSATAERQRVSYTRLSRLTHWSCTSL